MIIVYIDGGANEIRLTPNDQLGHDVYMHRFNKIICIIIKTTEFSRTTIYNMVRLCQGSELISSCALTVVLNCRIGGQY